jgi:ATP-dependent helicase/nuclease subunit A
LLSGVEPQKILCLTFTRAAAAEMSIRIMKRLSLWAVCDDGDLQHEIYKLQGVVPTHEQMIAARRLFAQVLSCPGGMRIRTIHAFCQEILRRFPIEAGLSPNFTVIEDSETTDLIEATQLDLLRQATTRPDSELGKALAYLVDELGAKALTEALRSFIGNRARYDAARSHLGDRLVPQLRQLLGLEPGDTTDKVLAAAVANDRTEIRHAATLLATGKNTFAERGQKILAWLALPPETAAQTFDDYFYCFFTQKNKPQVRLVSADLKKQHPDLETVFQREVTRLENIRQRLEAVRIADTTHAVLAAADFVLAGYAARKVRQAALDYDDLIIHTTALLQRASIAPWILYKLDGGLDHMLVDEAQDTSQAQWSIIASLAEEFFAGRGARDEVIRTLFVVGDEKQSIFSFQRADPEAFIGMRQAFAQRIAAAGRLYQEVPLQISFRSAPAILRAVDLVFAHDLARDGVSADPVHHWAHHAKKIGHVEIWPLAISPKVEKADGKVWQVPTAYEPELDPQAELANRIADTIDHWVTHKENMLGENRPIIPGDIMILLRRRGRFADLMVRALKKRHVPVTGVDRMRLITQLPVMDMLALLQFALLPEDDLNLATILRGPLLGLNEDQVMQLAIGRDGTLWLSLKSQAGSNPIFATYVAYLEGWLNEADFVTPFAMLTDILNRPCPGDSLGGRRAFWARLGPDALDPIDELLNAAQNFSRRHAPSLQGFLHWLTVTDSEIKRELDQGAGQVRIMTVHASKGLEAPIVFLPDAAGLPRSNDVDRVLWHDHLPLYAARQPKSGIAHRLWQTARHKQMQEYRRLLYVALTRAINLLYIAGWAKTTKEGQNPDSWYNLVKDALVTECQASPEAQNDWMPIASLTDPDPGDISEDKIASTVDVEPPLTDIPLPAWARTRPPTEIATHATLVPSHGALLPDLAAQQATAQPATATPDSVFTRGRLIHRLLQSLPDLPPEQQPAAAARFLANPQHGLDATQQASIAAEIITLLRHPDYAPLFGPASRAEVPLAGNIAGMPVAGQVDRLCVVGDEIWIVDYKTNRPPPLYVTGVPEIYRRQLAAYRLVLQAVYPGKVIRCFLLWTYGARLMELPAESLAT